MGNFGRGQLFALNFNIDITHIRVEVIMIIWENKIPGKQCCSEGGGCKYLKTSVHKEIFSPLFYKFTYMYTCI